MQSKYNPFIGKLYEHLPKHIFSNIAQFLRKMSSVSHQNICIIHFINIYILILAFCFLSLVAFDSKLYLRIENI